MYITLNDHYRERFGCKVYKLALDGGFTCPNRDGTLDDRGCIFCSAAGGGEFAEGSCGSVSEQLTRAKVRVRSKIKEGKFIAYFQSFSGTYAPVERLETLYREAMTDEDIVALAIGTRPDCLPPETVALLARLNREKPVYVELGLQTVHPKSIRYIRRGYDNEIYQNAVRDLKAAGIHVVTHIIIGLPGEDLSHAVETTRYAAESGTDGVKFHLLHVLRGTDLEQDFLAGKFEALTLEEYAQRLCACLSVLPEHIVVHRITGDGAKRDLISPLWSADKKRVLNFLNNAIKNT